MIQCPYCKLEFQPKGKRSNPQNSYYWGVIVKLLSDHIGFDPNEIHEILKHKFLAREMIIALGVGRRDATVITYSTTELDTTKMEEYLSKIRQWASQEFDMYIPLPHEEIPDA